MILGEIFGKKQIKYVHLQTEYRICSDCGLECPRLEKGYRIRITLFLLSFRKHGAADSFALSIEIAKMEYGHQGLDYGSTAMEYGNVQCH